MSYVDRMREAVKEETEAYLQYSRLADDAEEAGDRSAAIKIKMIAAEELEHSRAITRLLAARPPFSPERKRAKEVLGRMSEPMGIGSSPDPTESCSIDNWGQCQQMVCKYHGTCHKEAMLQPRPFPETYGDWVSLAEDIKAKDPDLSYLVNNHLLQISGNTDEAEEAKRWLTRKAGKLGIG